MCMTISYIHVYYTTHEMEDEEVAAGSRSMGLLQKIAPSPIAPSPTATASPGPEPGLPQSSTSCSASICPALDWTSRRHYVLQFFYSGNTKNERSQLCRQRRWRAVLWRFCHPCSAGVTSLTSTFFLGQYFEKKSSHLRTSLQWKKTCVLHGGKRKGDVW